MPVKAAQLNSDLVTDTARLTYKNSGRAVLTDLFTAKFAAKLHACLSSETDWNLVFRDNNKHYDLHPLQINALTTEKSQQLQQRVLANAKIGFQYLYNNFPLYDLRLNECGLHPDLAELCELLDSAEFIDLMRQVTADDAIEFADYQATKFVAGNFLKSHDDAVSGKNRRAAYVINLTPTWHADWGGLLEFVTADGKRTESLVPAYNTIILFQVPQPHFVSYVSPFAGEQRISITGWLRAR